MAGRVQQTHSSETSAVGAVGFGCTERGLAPFLPSTGAHAPGCQVPLTLLLPTPPDDGRDQAMIDWKLHAGWRLDGLLAGHEAFASPALLLVQVERAGQSLDAGSRALTDLLVRHGAIADADLITGFAVCWGSVGSGLCRVQITPAVSTGFRFSPAADGRTGLWHTEPAPVDRRAL